MQRDAQRRTLESVQTDIDELKPSKPASQQRQQWLKGSWQKHKRFTTKKLCVIAKYLTEQEKCLAEQDKYQKEQDLLLLQAQTAGLACC